MAALHLWSIYKHRRHHYFFVCVHTHDIAECDVKSLLYCEGTFTFPDCIHRLHRPMAMLNWCFMCSDIIPNSWCHTHHMSVNNHAPRFVSLARKFITRNPTIAFLGKNAAVLTLLWAVQVQGEVKFTWKPTLYVRVHSSEQYRGTLLRILLLAPALVPQVLSLSYLAIPTKKTH